MYSTPAKSLHGSPEGKQTSTKLRYTHTFSRYMTKCIIGITNKSHFCYINAKQLSILYYIHICIHIKLVFLKFFSLGLFHAFCLSKQVDITYWGPCKFCSWKRSIHREPRVKLSAGDLATQCWFKLLEPDTRQSILSIFTHSTILEKCFLITN